IAFSFLCAMFNDSATSTAPADDSFSGFIRFEVNKISTLTGIGRVSPAVEVKGIPLKLMTYKKNTSEFLEVFLYYGNNDSHIWSFDVAAQLSLVNADEKNNSLNIEFNTTFNCEIPSWGFEFISWEDLINKKKGFIKNNKITLEARFTLSKIIRNQNSSSFPFHGFE
ncbi:hypothetical protein PMAYCL1PPCAC_14726, partial [Pristionchus mayeri]